MIPMRFILFMIIITIFCGSCNPNKYFHIKRETNFANTIRLDGFFVAPLEGESERLYQLMLYKDGSFFLNGIVNINDQKQQFNDPDFLKLIRKFGYASTGIYRINNLDSTIIIERNIITDAFWKKTKRTKYGRVLNDTTFVVNIYGDRIDTFRFVQHAFKPDSSLFEKYKYIPKLKK